MDKYIILVETTPQLWERIRQANKNNPKPINIRQQLLHELSSRGFTFVEHDFMGVPGILLDRAQDIMAQPGAVQPRFMLEDMWKTIKSDFYPYRKIDECLNLNRQVLVFYTVFDRDEILQYINHAYKYHEQMGYIRNMKICNIRLTHDAIEEIQDGYDFLISCTGDYKFLGEDLGLAVDDFIRHDIFNEPRSNETVTKMKENAMDEILKTTTWYIKKAPQEYPTSKWNPFALGFDWRNIEFPPPKIGDITYAYDKYKIEDPLFTYHPVSY